jgi:hypothetical protein
MGFGGVAAILKYTATAENGQSWVTATRIPGDVVTNAADVGIFPGKHATFCFIFAQRGEGVSDPGIESMQVQLPNHDKSLETPQFRYNLAGDSPRSAIWEHKKNAKRFMRFYFHN